MIEIGIQFTGNGNGCKQCKNWMLAAQTLPGGFFFVGNSAAAASPPGQWTGFDIFGIWEVWNIGRRWIPILGSDVSDCGVIARVGLAVHCGSPNSCIISKPVARHQRVAVAVFPGLTFSLGWAI